MIFASFNLKKQITNFTKKNKSQIEPVTQNVTQYFISAAIQNSYIAQHNA